MRVLLDANITFALCGRERDAEAPLFEGYR